MSASLKSQKKTGACMGNRFIWRRCTSRHDLETGDRGRMRLNACRNTVGLRTARL
jgi:hypothetical protein